MSEENVEVVRRAISAYNRRDFEALRAVNDPDIELDWTESLGLDAGVYRGHDDVFAFFRQYFEAFPRIEIEPDRFIERGDAVVVSTSAQLVGRDGIETSARSFMVFRVENGHVMRLSVHQTMPELDLEELVRWAYAYFNREREPPPTWHPDGEFVNAREDPDHATYSGIEAIRKQHQGWFDSYPDLTVEPLEIRQNSDGDRVFVWAHFSGHGADSGAAMNMELAHVLTVDDEGKTRRLEEFFDRAEALRAAGLEP